MAIFTSNPGSLGDCPLLVYNAAMTPYLQKNPKNLSHKKYSYLDDAYTCLALQYIPR